ncbi:hypothetical protein ElyMa_006215200, partial [Elysia marginata]
NDSKPKPGFCFLCWLKKAAIRWLQICFGILVVLLVVVWLFVPKDKNVRYADDQGEAETVYEDGEEVEVMIYGGDGEDQKIIVYEQAVDRTDHDEDGPEGNFQRDTYLAPKQGQPNTDSFQLIKKTRSKESVT